MTYSAIRYELDGVVEIVTLARPDVLNAINGLMNAEMTRRLHGSCSAAGSLNTVYGGHRVSGL
jgi:enoyl-CoA hydratase/carnithine racemase